MKFNNLPPTLILLTILISGIAHAELATINSTSNNFPSSPIITDEEALSCKTDSIVKIHQSFPVSIKYLNGKVQSSYTKMRNGVIRHVTKEVALSLFNFSLNGFAAENIAHYVSEGTTPFLPFKFANGVKITKVTPKGNTIIYRTEMPISTNHKLAISLALAGKLSASTTICTDIKMVDNLLGRDVVIQYDYYDSNGVFFSSFTING